MATTLPPINQQNQKTTTGNHSNVLSAVKSTRTNSRIQVIQVSKGYKGKREIEHEQRQQKLRSEQARLSEVEASQFRNTYKHNLSLDMLQAGYHKSFCEMFALIKRQNDERLRAGPDSVLWTKTLLEDEPEKLDTLKKYLEQSELAEREENYPQMYECRFELARYFQSTNDKWLSDHFYSSCLTTSQMVQDDDGYLAAKGHCNVGLAQEDSNDNLEAAENFEFYLSLCESHKDWRTSDNQGTMYTDACTHLTRIYTTIAVQLEKLNNVQESLNYLIKAHENAKESGNQNLEGEASYRLGIAYEKNGDSETALLYLTSYFDSCQMTGDTTGLGKACEAMAKSYDSQGKVEESIKYLEKYVEVAEKNKDDKALSQACSDLGAMFNSLGRYEQAVEYFNKSYTISRAMNDTETISSSRVLFGVAAAHKMLGHVAVHVDIATRPCLERLIEWKDNRGDKFDKPLPTAQKSEMSRSNTNLSEKSQSGGDADEGEEEVEDRGEGDDASEGGVAEPTNTAGDTAATDVQPGQQGDSVQEG